MSDQIAKAKEGQLSVHMDAANAFARNMGGDLDRFNHCKLAHPWEVCVKTCWFRASEASGGSNGPWCCHDMRACQSQRFRTTFCGTAPSRTSSSGTGSWSEVFLAGISWVDSWVALGSVSLAQADGLSCCVSVLLRTMMQRNDWQRRSWRS